MSSFESDFDKILLAIADRAQHHDVTGHWPALDLAQLHDVGAMGWSLELPAYELHLRYEKLASASVATALILTQRDAAVGLIDAAADAPRRVELLEKLANNEIWTTVGIAQLTTSRQGGPPAVKATRTDGGYVLNGLIPWCTGLDHSQWIVAGAAMEDGLQILFLLDAQKPGVTLGPPMELVALTCTMTGPIELQQVFISDHDILRPPATNALSGRRNSLTLGQTFIATGLTQSALNLIAGHDSGRARAAHDRFAQQLSELRTEIATLCQPGREADAAAANARGARQLQRSGRSRDTRRHRPVQRLGPAAESPRSKTGSRSDVPAGLVVPQSGDRLHGGVAVGQLTSHYTNGSAMKARINRQPRKAIPKYLAAGMLSALVIALVFGTRLSSRLSEAVDAANLTFYDFYYTQRPLEDRTNGPVVIVAVDDASLKMLSEKYHYAWPWPREAWGRIATYLSNSGARAIAFDLLFDEPSQYNHASGDDQAFAKMIDAVKTPIIFGSMVKPDGTCFPFAPPISSPRLAAVNISDDKVNRTYKPVVYTRDSLASAILKAIGATQRLSNEEFLLHFYGPHQTDRGRHTYTYIPAANVLDVQLHGRKAEQQDEFPPILSKTKLS